jgi:hypothetical protein
MAAVVYDPYSAEVHQHPYPVFHRLREETPVYHNTGVHLLSEGRRAPRSTQVPVPGTVRRPGASGASRPGRCEPCRTAGRACRPEA